MTPTFGIDFGTTNTRVAYFDGQTIRAVPFKTGGTRVFQLPTALAYRNGEPVAYGADALTLPSDRGEPFAHPLKWALGSDRPVDIPGGSREPVEAVTDFLRYLRTSVQAELPGVPFDRAAVTIPVHYPPPARVRLQEAFEAAGVAVTHFFFEPIAAIYAGLAGEPAAGTAAVFDWGGGSLDVATVELRDGIALTRQVDGWHRGGTHFDQLLAEAAVNDFLAAHRDHPNARTVSTEQALKLPSVREVQRLAERIKQQLSQSDEKRLMADNLLGMGAMNFRVTADLFHELIRPDLECGLARLERALAASGVTKRTLARLFLSGGTCNLPWLRDQLAKVFGNRLVSRLRLPERLIDPRATGGLDDIGNATAVGAALLAAFGAAPVFASNLGVRLAGGRDGDRFHAVFRAGERVEFDKPREHKFFVSDAAGGVARLLVCDQSNDVEQPSGRLLRTLPVPIQEDDNWVVTRFTLDRHLALRVEATGRKDFPVDRKAWKTPHDAWVSSLNLGFRLPGGSTVGGAQ